MARLIDATRIEQFILNNCSDNEEINTIYGELINASTIDIVRCEECIHFHYDKPYIIQGIPVFGHEVCDFWGDGCKTNPNGFCSYGDRRADYTVFTVNPPKGVETPLKGDATVFHKNSKMGEKVARPTAASSTEVPWWIGE